MPLEEGDLGAGDEDVLTRASGRLLFLDLNLYHIGRVLDHLRDVRAMARTDFAEDALIDPDEATDKPVTL